MGRGERPEGDAPAPRRPRDTIRAVRVVAGRWADLYALGDAILLIPEKDPTDANPDRMKLTAWRATAIAGGWEPVEELADGVRHINDPWNMTWPWER